VTGTAFAATGGWLSPRQAYAEAQNIVDLIRDSAAKGGALSCNLHAAALVASIEKTIGPLPVFTGPSSWNAIAAAKPREYIHELNGRRDLNLSLHQMLGVATDIQGTAAELQAAGTILLLQIDSDTSLHEQFTFCDMGAAQFWIEPADLANGRFYKAWGTSEGG
jgi:hypothetical protein